MLDRQERVYKIQFTEVLIMTVKDIKEMFADFNDNQKIYFEISDSDVEKLFDSYRYSPTISSLHLDNLGDLIVTIASEYTR